MYSRFAKDDDDAFVGGRGVCERRREAAWGAAPGEWRPCSLLERTLRLRAASRRGAGSGSPVEEVEEEEEEEEEFGGAWWPLPLGREVVRAVSGGWCRVEGGGGGTSEDGGLEGQGSGGTSDT